MDVALDHRLKLGKAVAKVMLLICRCINNAVGACLREHCDFDALVQSSACVALISRDLCRMEANLYSKS